MHNTAGRSLAQQLERRTNTMIGARSSNALVYVYLWSGRVHYVGSPTVCISKFLRNFSPLFFWTISELCMSKVVRSNFNFLHNSQWITFPTQPYTLGCPRGVMVKAMNCGIVVREFVLQSRYYVHFRANTLGKGMNPLILPPAMGK